MRMEENVCEELIRTYKKKVNGKFLTELSSVEAQAYIRQQREAIMNLRSEVQDL